MLGAQSYPDFYQNSKKKEFQRETGWDRSQRVGQTYVNILALLFNTQAT